MTAGLEAAAAEDFIYGTLHGDATLMALVSDVWNTQAPQDAPFPFVVFQFMSGNPYAAVGAYRIWENMVFQVKVIGNTADFSDLDAAAARIDTLLQRGSGVVADGTVWSCVREQSIRMPELVAGDSFRHSGALWRLYAT